MHYFESLIPNLFAQAAQGAQNDTGQFSFYLTLLPILFFLYYFMVLRPGSQNERQRRQMLAELKKNDRVLTDAGIYGTVVSVDPESDKVVLRVDDDKGVKLTFIRSKVVRVLDAAPDKDKAKEKEKTAETV
jgi:preprotein translocase subunit YajC